MLKLSLPAFDTVFLTQYIHNPRAMEAEALLAIAQQLRAAADGRHAPAPRHRPPRRRLAIGPPWPLPKI